MPLCDFLRAKRFSDPGTGGALRFLRCRFSMETNPNGTWKLYVIDDTAGIWGHFQRLDS